MGSIIMIPRDMDKFMAVQCQHCGEWVPADGPDGYFVHVRTEHPDSGLSKALNDFLDR